MECSDATHVIAFDEQRRLHIADKTRRTACRSLPNIDVTRDVRELQFVNAKTSCLTDSAVEASRVLAELRVIFAADTLGAAQYMLDAAVAYALDRKQFGCVIGFIRRLNTCVQTWQPSLNRVAPLYGMQRMRWMQMTNRPLIFRVWPKPTQAKFNLSHGRPQRFMVAWASPICLGYIFGSSDR